MAIFYGGSELEFGLGVKKIFIFFQKEHIRLGIEYLFSLNTNKNGLQMKNDNKLIIVYQMSF